jgi:hypothetical protein
MKVRTRFKGCTKASYFFVSLMAAKWDRQIKGTSVPQVHDERIVSEKAINSASPYTANMYRACTSVPPHV